MTPEALFTVCNTAALLSWVALAAATLSPRLRAAVWPAVGVALPGALAVIYVGALVAGIAGGAQGGFGSIAEVRSLFQNDHALLAGWVHYLAFDLVIGVLIARDAAKAGIGWPFVLPLLALTFLFGPAGLLAYLIVRVAARGRVSEVLS